VLICPAKSARTGLLAAEAVRGGAGFATTASVVVRGAGAGAGIARADARDDVAAGLIVGEDADGGTAARTGGRTPGAVTVVSATAAAAAVVPAGTNGSTTARPAGAKALAGAGAAAVGTERAITDVAGTLADVGGTVGSHGASAACGSWANGSHGASKLSCGAVAIRTGASIVPLKEGGAETISTGGSKAAVDALAMSYEGAASRAGAGFTLAEAGSKLTCAAARTGASPGTKVATGRTSASACGGSRPRSRIAA